MHKGLGVLVAIVILSASETDASAQRPGGRRGPGGRPSFDRLLQAFDGDEDGELSEEETPPRVWERLSKADADGNGRVTRDEFDGYRP